MLLTLLSFGPRAPSLAGLIFARVGLSFSDFDLSHNSPAPHWQFHATAYRQIHSAVQKMLLGLAIQGSALRSTRPTPANAGDSPTACLTAPAAAPPYCAPITSAVLLDALNQATEVHKMTFHGTERIGHEALELCEKLLRKTRSRSAADLPLY
jgi:hypothetical protein